MRELSAKRSRRSYKEFLRRFAVLREEVHADYDSFDMGYYAYGLSLYGNMPLIEPLETRETYKIRDFVIVLDTSYSVSGELVEHFLQETFTILTESDSFFVRNKIRIIQCDDSVKTDEEITDEKQIKPLLNKFTLVGGGGTDFRPAFSYVRDLLDKGELKNMCGLIYFTDGKGIFPAKCPSYKCAFVSVGAYEGNEVPPWGDAGGAGGNNMNIKQAKNEVKNTVKAYLSKDAHGEYVIPQIRQRPMLLIGPPGVGKTQIMEQIARECKIGLVAYTITHHTRQSAVGLPFIKEREYDGKSYSVTEYTMSEIIASVYERMEATGLKEGILFIDEINCVSETLAPTMLQFLQCKTFGNQAVPKGWVIVAAGNPPEYNKSVRDFDMVTLDRVRYISIEADYQVWKEYARDVHIHDALLSYLELHPNNFYRVETDVDGMNFVTARGWEDLSSLLKVYEAGELAVTEEVIGEFIHHPDIAEDVYAYLEIYRKYNEDYGISDILSGNVKKSVYKRVFDADFDERITVVNLLLSGLTVVFSDVARERKMVQLWYEFLKEYRKSQRSTEEQHALYNSAVEQFSKNMEILKESSLILPKEYYIRQDVLKHIKGDFDTVMDDFTEESEKLSTMEDAAGEKLNHAFDFVEDVFSDGQEMLVFVTELTITPEISGFLAENECEKFDIYNEKLMVGSNRTRLLKELER